MEIDDPLTIPQLKVDISSLPTINFGSEANVKGIIVTAKSKEGPYDFISRYFAPWVGIPEDPVTGSAHTALGIFLSHFLKQYSRILVKETRQNKNVCFPSQP